MEKLRGQVNTDLSGSKSRNVKISQSQQKCELHPLIHTRRKFKLAQYMVSCQRGKENPHRPTLVDRWGR
jgi:hypothetical protein